MKLMKKSVTAESAKGYEVAWRRWKVFVHSFTGTVEVNTLEDYQSLPTGRAHFNQMLIAQFAEYLYTEFSLGAERASGLFSGLSFSFMMREGDLAAFESAQLEAVQKGMRNEPLPANWESSQRLPMPVDMILAIRNKNIGPDASWEQQATAVGIVLAFCCLLRPFEYLVKTKSDKHMLLAKSVQFEVTLPYSEPQMYTAHEVAALGV
jgi:hypothetical protein